ncbi:hypothetical protein J6590_070779 [Homalodisca vitripennis]|nr:hypothetical protein J6590_070779 [Homalodisca vitripennis]
MRVRRCLHETELYIAKQTMRGGSLEMLEVNNFNFLVKGLPRRRANGGITTHRDSTFVATQSTPTCDIRDNFTYNTLVLSLPTLLLRDNDTPTSGGPYLLASLLDLENKLLRRHLKGLISTLGVTK